MLTIVDNTHHPEFDDLLGFDLGRTAAVAKEFGVTIDIEDPYTEWIKPPERYIALGASYQQLLGDSLHDGHQCRPHGAGQAAGLQHRAGCGTEFLQLWKCASEATGRVCFYCESSVYEGDWKLLHLPWRRGECNACRRQLHRRCTSTVLLRGAGAKGERFSMTDRGPLWGTLKQSSLRDITRSASPGRELIPEEYPSPQSLASSWTPHGSERISSWMSNHPGAALWDSAGFR